MVSSYASDAWNRVCCYFVVAGISTVSALSFAAETGDHAITPLRYLLDIHRAKSRRPSLRLDARQFSPVEQ
jgi:hypothetical protein